MQMKHWEVPDTLIVNYYLLASLQTASAPHVSIPVFHDIERKFPKFRQSTIAVSRCFYLTASSEPGVILVKTPPATFTELILLLSVHVG